MKITWIGHACFLIEAEAARVLTDPFGEEVPYTFLDAPVDLVTISHDHFDHNADHRITGKHTTIRATGRFDVHGVTVRGLPSFHDDSGGTQRGENVLYTFDLEGMRLAHLGDLGAPLDEPQRDGLAGTEILLVPVGGQFTIDARQAARIARSLPDVRVVVPMHFRTERIADWPIAPVEEFAALMDNVRRVGASTADLTRASLPGQREVWILDHA